MSLVEDLLAVLDWPLRARPLLTVRAAISFARLVLAPWSFSDALMCSYWRSCLLVHSFGMSHLLMGRVPDWASANLSRQNRRSRATARVPRQVSPGAARRWRRPRAARAVRRCAPESRPEWCHVRC